MTSSRTLKYKKDHIALAFQIKSLRPLNPGWWAGYVKSGGISPPPLKLCGGPEDLPSTEHLRKSLGTYARLACLKGWGSTQS